MSPSSPVRVSSLAERRCSCLQRNCLIQIDQNAGKRRHRPMTSTSPAAWKRPAFSPSRRKTPPGECVFTTSTSATWLTHAWDLTFLRKKILLHFFGNGKNNFTFTSVSNLFLLRTHCFQSARDRFSRSAILFHRLSHTEIRLFDILLYNVRVNSSFSLWEENI